MWLQEEPGLGPDDPDCTRDVMGLMEVPCACGWVCDALFWVPAVELVFGSIGTALVLVCGHDDQAGFGVCLSMGFCAAFSWPLYAGGPLSHWAVAYLLAPVCAGSGLTFVALLPFLAAGVASNDIEEMAIWCSGFLGFILYLSATICK